MGRNYGTFAPRWPRWRNGGLSSVCTGGRVLNYLKRFLGEPNTDVLFVSYQGRGTPGRDRCDFVSNMREPPREVVLVHGEDESKVALGAKPTELGIDVR